MKLVQGASVSSLLVVMALAVRCRLPESVGTMGAITVPEGFGGRTAPRELPDLSAEGWAASRAVRRCETGVCRVSATFDDERTPAKMSSWLLEPGTSLRIEPDRSVDVFAMVLAGQVFASKPVSYRSEPRERDDEPIVRAWTVVRSSGEGLLLSNGSSDPPVALVLVIARDPPVAMHESDGPSAADAGAGDASAASDGGARANESAHPRMLSPAERLRSPLEVRRLADIEWLSWDAGAFRAKLVFEGRESPRASLSVLVGGATANVPPHTHEHSYELLTAVVADGMVNVWGTGEGSLGHQSVVRPGDSQVIPMGVRHEWVAAGTVPLIAVQAYAPSGPEQRFREWARH